MIKVTVVRSTEGRIGGFFVNGHANFGEHGKDIVCAGVSAIAYTAVGALNNIAGVGSYQEDDGQMVCSIPDKLKRDIDIKAQVILESAVIGFRQIENAYKKYVIVNDKEV